MVTRFLAAALGGLLLGLPQRGQAQASNVFTWQQTYGTAQDEKEGFAVAQNGGYLLVGQQTQPRTGVIELYFVQTDSQGDTLWTRRVGAPFTLNPQITGFVRNQAGTLLVTGQGYGGPTFGFAMAFTSACVPLWSWTRQLSFPVVAGADFTATFVGKPLVGADDNFLLLRSLFSFNTSSQTSKNDEALLKVNQATGAEMWSARLDSLMGQHGHLKAWSRSANGFFAIVENNDPFTPGAAVGVLKLGMTGNFISYRTRPSMVPYDIPSYIASRDAVGNILLAGNQRLTKFDPRGDTLWHTNVPAHYGPQLWDGAAVVQERQGNYVVLGNGTYFGSTMHLARFRPTGQLLSDTLLARNGDIAGRSLLLAANSDVVISGYAGNAPRGGSDLFMFQYRGFRPLATHAEAAAKAGFQVYPNPAEAATNRVTVTLPEGSGPAMFTVQDMLGRVVRQQPVSAATRDATVPVAGLPPGLYVLRLVAANGQVWATKLQRE